MKYFLPLIASLMLICLTIDGAFGHSKVNKTPKHGWSDACDECQTIISRIAAVAKDRTKVAELKILLEALCHETSYEEECRLFVSKLDLFLDRLLPYLKDPQHVCKELHICANRRLEQFHRIGMLYARHYLRTGNGPKDLLCEECQLAAHELSQEINDPKFQQDAQNWLENNVCAEMGSWKDTCDEFLAAYLPELWQELQGILADQKKFCQELELCPTAHGHRHRYHSSSSKGKVSRHLLGLGDANDDEEE